MSDQERIDSLVVRYEELRERGTPLSAEELCADCPELLAELKQQLRVLESMNVLLGDADSEEASSDLLEPDTAPAPPLSAEAVAAATRYRVLRLHATGGLGEVLVAHDEDLHRDVALKRLQAPHTHNPESRSRFLREAEITSRLEHPSIVPVHTVGQDAEGRPFYAMRFIQGETLREASQRHHAAGPPRRDPGERRVALRQLLSRFVAVCNTIAYAHSRGIVHRDIKPDNIILGPFGETLVLDWGLAKELSEAGSTGVEGPEPGAPDDAGADTRPRGPTPTRDGAVIGTPPYMSPEQAAGRADELGPASDVYSLGATLYVLLTGAAPFQGRQVPEILDKVKRADFLPPRQRKKDIPPALDAICMKAMAGQPQQRYGTALALAADVEHWLADEPVSAWREPWTTRLRRWSSRHRTLMAVGAAAAVVALVSLTAATVLLNAANQRERDARGLAEQNAQVARDERHTAEEQRDEADKQKQLAAQNLQRALQVVDQYCLSVAQDPRLQAHDLEGLRTALLQMAAKFCDEFVRRQSDDPAVLAEQGRAYLLLGFITDETATKPEAISHYQKAQAIFAVLARDNPTVADFQRNLAQSHDHLGKLFGDTGQPAAAFEEYTESFRIRKELLKTHPGEADYQNDLGVSHGLLGLWYQKQRQWDRAREELGQSIKIREDLLGTHPGVLAYQAGLADAHTNLSIVYRGLGQLKRSEEELLQVLKTWDERARVQPLDSDVRSRLATSHFDLAVVYADLHRADEAETSFKIALELREKLVHTHPTVTDYQTKLAHSYHNLGSLYQETKRLAEAETAFAKTVDINKKLAATHPKVIGYAVDLGKTYCHLGYLLKNQRKPEAALDWFEEAARTHEAVLQREPGQADARESLGYVHDGRAMVLMQLQRPREALEAWNQAVDVAQAVLERQPGHAETRERLGKMHAGRAGALTQLQQPREALEAWNQALDLAEGPNRIFWRGNRAMTLTKVGDHAKAASEAAALADESSLPIVQLYFLARVQARAAAIVLTDEQLATEEQQKLAEDYAAQAVKLLRRLQAAGQLKGPVRLAQLQKDPDLAALRSRADFKGLLNELEDKERTEKK
jgi:eukaryotic-like serine/threonine-protein kinase